jgi:DNA-binding ferritin-like protein
LETHYENCIKIEEAFKKLTNFLGLDNFSELPTVFKKTEQQISNINFYNEKLDLQIDELEQRRDSIIEKIKLLSGKQTENISNKSKFKEQKQQSIKVIENLIQNFEGDMEHKRELFLRIQPITDKYLARLSETYLVDFIPNKANIDPDIDYNEQTVNKYMSNVQDYYKLIQSWDEANKSAKGDDNRELDKLREEMKQKLGGFEKNRIISKKLVTSMKNELKGGMNIEDIIKKASLEISRQPNLNASFASNPYNKSLKHEPNNSSMNNNSQLPTEAMNNYNESVLNNRQNSMIMYPNNSSTLHNNSSGQENNKVPEAA